jgi:hypothetical protein
MGAPVGASLALPPTTGSRNRMGEAGKNGAADSTQALSGAWIWQISRPWGEVTWDSDSSSARESDSGIASGRLIERPFSARRQVWLELAERFSDEPIGEVVGCIPRTGHPARVLIHARDELGIIQSQQNRVKPIDDLLHEFAHFVIADA